MNNQQHRLSLKKRHPYLLETRLGTSASFPGRAAYANGIEVSFHRVINSWIHTRDLLSQNTPFCSFSRAQRAMGLTWEREYTVIALNKFEFRRWETRVFVRFIQMESVISVWGRCISLKIGGLVCELSFMKIFSDYICLLGDLLTNPKPSFQNSTCICGVEISSNSSFDPLGGMQRPSLFKQKPLPCAIIVTWGFHWIIVSNIQPSILFEFQRHGARPLHWTSKEKLLPYRSKMHTKWQFISLPISIIVNLILPFSFFELLDILLEWGISANESSNGDSLLSVLPCK